MNPLNSIHRCSVLILAALYFSTAGLSLMAQDPPRNSTPAKVDQPSPKGDDQTDPVVISLHDQSIKASEFKQILSHLPPQQRRQYDGPAGARAFAEYLVQILVLSRGAEQEGLDRIPDIAAQLKFGRAQVMASAEQQAILNRVWVSDEEVRRYYDQNQNQFVQLHLLHISLRLTGSDLGQDAQIRKGLEEVRRRTLKGEDFRALAREFSRDSDAQAGGDLGFRGRGSFGEAVDSIVFRLKPGEISEVFDAPGALHLFKALEDRPQPFAEASAAIVEILKNRILQASVESLVHEKQPVVNEEYFARESESASAQMSMTVQVKKDGKPVGSPVVIPLPSPAKDKRK
jgi:peptidyl-prolyl cis-trans isomerase C